MYQWFLYFLIYSFLGFCLEKLFARAVRADKQNRKCFLVLPLCPVYGLAMAALLYIAPEGMPFFPLTLLGGAVCTAVEYLVHLFYDKVFGVWFWDYRLMRGHIRGRICPQFALIWGVLSAAAVRWVHPSAAALASRFPPEAAYGLWLALAADGVFTASLLLRYHDTELLALPAVLAQARASSQSSTSR